MAVVKGEHWSRAGITSYYGSTVQHQRSPACLAKLPVNALTINFGLEVRRDRGTDYILKKEMLTTAVVHTTY